MDEQARSVIARARANGGLSRQEVELLLGFDAGSAEARAMNAAAKELAFEAAGGQGRIYAQIGVDGLPCPENCRFCSFAACNADPEDARGAIMPVDEVAGYARVLADAGCHLISLMATAALPFAACLDMVSAAATAVDGRALIMANAGDVTEEQARALKEAGAGAAYHALRLGEGVITDIRPEQRLHTMENISAAGLRLMSGVEPLYEGVDESELMDAILLQRTLRPFCTGACPLTLAEGASLDAVPASRERVRQVASIIRLACGMEVPFGAGGGISWVDAGTDPRDRGYAFHPDHLRRQVQAKREVLEAGGWRCA